MYYTKLAVYLHNYKYILWKQDMSGKSGQNPLVTILTHFVQVIIILFMYRNLQYFTILYRLVYTRSRGGGSLNFLKK